ncbi:MAG: MarR family winged helix-turn-helix transcriptional regulator, partial [Thermoguttaceae bacterium]
TPEPSSLARQWVELAQRMLVCARMFRNELGQRAGRWQLSEPELAMLWTCREAPTEGFSQTELAQRLAVSAAGVSGLVEQLRGAGLLEGHRTTPDRRRQFWKLTPAGEATLQTILADVSGMVRRIDIQLGESKLSDQQTPEVESREEDWQRLVRMLDELIDAHTRQSNHPQRSQRRTASFESNKRKGAA